MMNTLKTKHIIILLLLSYAFFFHGIGDYSLKEPDEGRYAEISREMNELNDYIVPHLNYVRYFEKPPLLYWINALSFKLFGISEQAARFPNALCAFFCVIFLYFFVQRYFNEHMAFLSSVILITSFGFLAMSRIVTTDMLFTTCLFLSFLFFYAFYYEKKPFLIYLFYVALGAATLAKGPVTLILMGGTILLFLLTERNFSFIREMRLLKGLGIYLMITLPWVVAISLREKEFLYFFFIDQHILRFLTSKHKRSGPIYYFLPVLFVGMLPWSIFIPRAVVNTLKKKEMRFALIWVLVVFAFFSFSGSKLPPYILPVFPPMAIILGYLFHNTWESHTYRKWETPLYIVFFLLFGTASLSTQIPIFNPYIQKILDDTPILIKDLRILFLWLTFFSYSIVLFLILKKCAAGHVWTFILLSSFSLALMLGILFHLHILDKVKTVKDLTMIINTEKENADYIINYASFNPSIPFYIRTGITIAAYTGELEMGSKYEDAKKIFIGSDDFMRLLSSNKKVLFTAREKRIKELQDMFPGRIHIQDCQKDRCLARNF